MKKSIIFIILLILFINMAYAGNNTSETQYHTYSIEYSDNITHTLEGGDSNIEFANGYRGYCVEYREKSAEKDDKFYVTNTSHITNKNNNQDVSNHIKTFFTYFYNNTQSNNLTYNGKPVDQTIYNQHIIWYFTNDFSSPITDNSTELLNNIIKKSNTMIIPDDGILKIDNKTEMSYSFRGLLSFFEEHQNYFGYNISFRNVSDNITPDVNNNKNNTNISEENKNTTDLDNEHNSKTTQQKQHNHDHYSSINILSLNNLKTGNPLFALLIVLLISAAIMIYKE